MNVHHLWFIIQFLNVNFCERTMHAHTINLYFDIDFCERNTRARRLASVGLAQARLNIHIYIYRERERERVKSVSIPPNTLSNVPRPVNMSDASNTLHWNVILTSA